MSDREDGFICGTGLDEAEHASFGDVFETRAEAIAAGREDIGWTDSAWFQTGKLRNEISEMPNQLDAEHACDCAENSEWGEAMHEQWQDRVFGDTKNAAGLTPLEDLQARLDKVWDEWQAAHDLRVNGFYIDDLESHPFVDVDGEV